MKLPGKQPTDVEVLFLSGGGVTASSQARHDLDIPESKSKRGEESGAPRRLKDR